MKKTIAIIVAVMLSVLSCFFAYAENVSLSGYSDEELYALYTSVQQEIQKRTEEKLPSPTSDFIYASNGQEVRINAYTGTSLDVVIPDEIDQVPVTIIYESAFKNSSVTRVRLPAHLREVGAYAFEYSQRLTGILDIPASVEMIELDAFGRTNLTGVIINSSFDAPYNPFIDLYEAEFLFIREGMNPTFKNGAFLRCPKMRIAIIPSSVSFLPDDAFTGCNVLTIITPKGSPAEEWAKSHFFPVDTEHYEEYVAEYEALYPQHW